MSDTVTAADEVDVLRVDGTDVGMATAGHNVSAMSWASS